MRASFDRSGAANRDVETNLGEFIPDGLSEE